MNYAIRKSWEDEEDHGHGWLIEDFQGHVVARCMSQHNAELICKLLNNFS